MVRVRFLNSLLPGLLLLIFSTVAYGELRLPATEPILGFGFTNIFPTLRFEQPVGITNPPGETNRLFLLERRGRIIVIPDLAVPRSETFLDLTSSTWSQGIESGLLGFAFHPDYARNGRFYLYRTTSPNSLRNQLSEFRRDPQNPNRAESGSERVLISQIDDFDTHNAGDLKFGPDGYLYLSIGDEKPAFEDIHTTPQAIDKGLFAAILRIDVDAMDGSLSPNPHRSAVGQYSIPQDNPFVGVTSFAGLPVDPSQVRTELYAVGLRNPWRFTFDRSNGEMICADVGAGTWEEINIVEAGGNYGWPYFEGTLQHITDTPTENLRLPLYQYSRGRGVFEGTVVIGGLVYEGPDLPGLDGKYIFADFESGNVWSLNTRARETNAVWLTGRRGISTFATDPRDGGVLTANLLAGTVEKLIYRAPDESGVPLWLSEVNAFKDLATLTPNDSVLPFEVINPLWSDGAAKRRWMSLAGMNGKIGFSATEPWRIPAGAVWIKHFELELTNGLPESRRRLETRFLVQTTNGVYGLSYRWGDSLTNAMLLPAHQTDETFLVNDGGIIKTQVWSYPGWDQCKTCHKDNAGGALSFNTYQLNRPGDAGNPTNQLEWLASHGVFEDPEAIEPSVLPNLVAVDDPAAPLQHKVRSYLFSNCAHCHRPGNLLVPPWDARISTPLAQANIIDAPTFGYPPPMKIITPHRDEYSLLLQRAASRAPFLQMPPLATSSADTQFLTILTNWINSFPDGTWSSTDIGEHLAEGAAEQSGEKFRISSAGRGIDENSFFYFHRTASDATEFRARVADLKSSTPQAEAGLMMRQDLIPGNAYAAIFVKNEFIHFQGRGTGDARPERITLKPVFSTVWLKLINSGNEVSGWSSSDGENWERVGTLQAGLGASFELGLFTASSAPAVSYASAQFDSYSVQSVNVRVPDPGPHILPRTIRLEGTVSLLPETEATLSYFAADQLIDTVVSAPFTLLWKPERNGEIPITAVLTTASGSITSQPVTIELVAPQPQLSLLRSDIETRGDWNSGYGSESVLIPGYLTNISSTLIRTPYAEAVVIGESEDSSALVTEQGRIASILKREGFLEVTFAPVNFELHKGALYFMDWMGLGSTQTISFYQEGLLVGAPQTITAETGEYLTFVFRGEVTVRIENSAEAAYVAAAFCDPLQGMMVNFAKPVNNQTLQQPDVLELEVSAHAPDRAMVQVEIRSDNRPVAILAPPFRTNLAGFPFGTHTLSAIATSEYGSTAESAPVTINILPPPGNVRFLGVDANTKGTWMGRYGSAGYWIVEETIQIPEFLRINLHDYHTFTFASESLSLSALERPQGGFRIAACLVGSPQFSFEIDVVDGRKTCVGFYFLDWGHAGRVIDVEVRDTSGHLLDARQVQEFGDGKHLFWDVEGQAIFRFSSPSINAVVSAFFVEDRLTPYQLWKYSTFSPDEVEAAGTGFDLWDADGDGFDNALEYALGYDARLADDQPVITWSYNGETFSMTLSRRTNSSEVRPIFERSEDLIHWEPVAGVANLVGRLVAEIDLGGRRSQFLRVRGSPVKDPR